MVRFLRPVLLFFLLFPALASIARADRLIVQRGDSLYTSTANGGGLRLILVIGKAPSSLWAATGDGHRLAYLFRVDRRAVPRGTEPVRVEGLHTRPAVVYTCDLSGRRKKRLVSTSDLRDRSGNRVTQLSIGQAVPTTDPFDDWEMESIAWSADGRTLYFCCLRTSRTRERATFAVDAATGTALVDGRGYWKAIAPMVAADARDTLLTGAGRDFFRTATQSRDIPFAPLLLLDLSTGKLTQIPAAGSDPATEAPEYGSVVSPALAPDARRIAFAATVGGLWLTDLNGTVLTRLQSGTITQVRWSPSGSRLYFLSRTRTTSDLPRSTLLSLPAPKIGDDAPDSPPVRVLENVDRFAVVP